MRRVALAVAAVAIQAVTGCKDQTFAPRVTPEQMPAGFESLVLGVSDEAAVRAVLPDATREADKQLGGDMVVRRNDAPAIVLSASTRAAQRARLERMQIPEASIEAELAGRPATLPDDFPWSSVEASLVQTEAGAPPRLQWLVVRRPVPDGEPPCQFLVEAYGDDPEATRCGRSNRVFGEHGKGGSADYCIGTADGKQALVVECYPMTSGGKTTIELSYSAHW